MKNTIRKYLPFGITALVALVIGAGIGAAGSSSSTTAGSPSKPAPVETVTVEVPAPADAEQLGACQRAAEELRSIAIDQVNNVTMPYGDVSGILYNQLVNSVNYGAGAVDMSEIERGTGVLNSIADAAKGLTSRVEAISPDFATCVG